jgi:hypothetical protein
MDSVLKRSLVAVGVSTLVTSISLLVTESVDVSFANGGGTTTVSGFPLPFLYLFDGTNYFYPQYMMVDLFVWGLLTFSIVTVMRRPLSLGIISIGLVAGVVVTLASLGLPPLPIVDPTPGSETTTFVTMGFPYEYLIYSGGGNYAFNLTRGLADYSLWSVIILIILGLSGSRSRS